MKAYKTFVPPTSLLAQLGEEWSGTYTIHVLTAKEYLNVAEELTQKKRLESQAKNKVWVGEITETELRSAVIYRAVTKDGAALTADLPSKLFEILAFIAVPLNMITQSEGQELLKLFRDPTKN